MSRKLLFLRTCLALIILMTSLLGTSALAQGATVVRIDPAVSSVQVGDQVNVSVKIDNVANLTAFELHLAFDPNILEVVQISNGGFVAADFVAQSVFDNSTGTLDYAIAQMNRPPAQGSGALLNITFNAKTSGSANVNVRATPGTSDGFLLSDQNGTAIAASWSGGTINVGGGGPTVTPSVTAPPSDTPTLTPTPDGSPTETPTSIPVNWLTPTPTTTFTPTNTASPTATPTKTASPTPTRVPTTAVVRIDPATITVNAYDTFVAFVKVDNATSLSAFEIHLWFDANVLEVKDLANGGFLIADVVAQNTFNNTAGTIDYAIAQRNRQSVNGGGTLLAITFRAKPINGSTRVDLRGVTSAPTGLLLSDANGMALPASWTAGNFTATNINQSRIHVVQWGEWLFCIGRAYRVDPWAIAQANGIWWWPYIIFPGQQLIIPNVPWMDMPPSGPTCSPQFTPAPPRPPVVPPPTYTPFPVTVMPPPPFITPIPPLTCRAIYYVRSGDTLYQIGRMFGVNYLDIVRANQIPNSRIIYVGQRLCIP